MRDKLKSFLKHWPLFYCFVQSWYWRICSLKACLFGTEIEERKWAKRHLLKRSDWQDNEDWVSGYWNSRSHPHRQLLIDKISQYLPLSILEIGSNCGPNLYLLAKKFPKAKIIGIDINKEAVKKGNEFFVKEGIPNVELFFGKADTLNQFQDKSFDVVFTDAVLMYIGPDKIKKVIEDIIRITRRAAIFIEWHYENQKYLGEYDPHIGVWKRNYLNLMKSFVKENQICISKIPEELWPDKNWQKIGYIIEVKI